MSEEEIFKTLEKACILDKNCYEVDCLLEKDLIAIRELIKLYKNQQKEIEEKTTILLAGAEKVKQLEKEIKELKEKNAQLTNYLNDSYYVSADKIKEIIENAEADIDYLTHDLIEDLNKLLEENDE